MPVLTPALTITKTASTTTATPGATVAYTVTITNTGQVPYTGASVTDPLGGVLDDAAYNGNASATTGSVSFTSPDLTWTGNLDPAAAATITYTITVHNPDTGNHILANTVTSAAAGNNCPAGGTDPRCASTVDVSVLTIMNTASTATTTPGSAVAYTITITNTGQTPYDGAAVTDPLAGVLDDAAYNSDATATAGSVTFTSPDLTWTGDLAPGAAATITFTVTVNNPDTGDKSLTSTITSAAAGNNCPAGGTDPALHRHRHRPDPGADHHQDRVGEHGHARLHGGLHHHRPQHRPDALQRGERHRPAGRRAQRRHLQQQRRRDHRHRLLRQPRADLDR